VFYFSIQNVSEAVVNSRSAIFTDLGGFNLFLQLTGTNFEVVFPPASDVQTLVLFVSFATGPEGACSTFTVRCLTRTYSVSNSKTFSYLCFFQSPRE